MKPFRPTVTAAIAVLVLQSAPDALAEDICVEPVPFATTAGSAASPDEVPPYGPETLFALPGLGIFASRRVPPAGRRDPQRDLFWSYGDDRMMHGPSDPGFWIPDPDHGDRASSPDETLIVQGRYVTDGRRWDWVETLLRLTTTSAGLAVEPVKEVKFHGSLKVFWSGLQQAFVVSGFEEKERNCTDKVCTLEGNSFTASLSGGRLAKLWDRKADLVSDLPQLGGTALLSFDQLAIAEPGTEAVSVRRLSSGSDYNGWKSIVALLPPGRIYIGGAQFDYVLQLSRSDGTWKPGKTVRFAQEDDVNGERFGAWLGARSKSTDGDGVLIKRDACHVVDPALGSVFSCGEGITELRDGSFVPIPGGQNLTRYIGSSGVLGIAVFLGDDGRLWSYDGKEPRPMEGASVGGGVIREFPASRRTFIASRSGLFEIIRKGDSFALAEIVGMQKEPFDVSAELVDAPDGDGLILFARPGVYRIKGQRADLVWRPVDGAGIKAGRLVPVAGRREVLFGVEGRAGPLPSDGFVDRLFRLRVCP